MRLVEAEDLDLAAYIRPGDTVMWSQACGEPQTLTESLVAQRAGLGRIKIFVGVCFTDTLKPEYSDHFDFLGYGAIGTSRNLSRGGRLDIIPAHLSKIPEYLRDGQIPSDVVLIQVSGPNRDGLYSPGATNDYIRVAMERARVVIAEINRQAPWTEADALISEADIHIGVHTDRPLAALRPAGIGDVERRIALHVGEFVPDRAVLQMGIGGIPEAVMALLEDRKDLGIHSGMIGDSVVDLMRSGAVTNAYKAIDRGRTVTGLLIGTDKLFRFAHENPAILMTGNDYTHGAATLARFERFISINSALEVDLTGQVNAEAIGHTYLGAVGGQVDYVRAAAASPGGRSIIALQSTSASGSKVVPRLSGPVTTARSDVDLIVTEWGAADLRGRSLRQRAAALISIADPVHREALEREAAAQGIGF